MRIRTKGDKQYREAIIDGLASDLDENRTDALVDAAEHTRADIEAKAELAEWVGAEIEAGRLSVEQANELLGIFSGRNFIVEPALEVDIATGARFDVTVDSASPAKQ
jgi:hypothetical protein